MKEVKSVANERQEAEQRQDPSAEKNEIRVLESFELVLAGGGDGEATWPR